MDGWRDGRNGRLPSIAPRTRTGWCSGVCWRWKVLRACCCRQVAASSSKQQHAAASRSNTQPGWMARERAHGKNHVAVVLSGCFVNCGVGEEEGRKAGGRGVAAVLHVREAGYCVLRHGSRYLYLVTVSEICPSAPSAPSSISCNAPLAALLPPTRVSPHFPSFPSNLAPLLWTHCITHRIQLSSAPQPRRPRPSIAWTRVPAPTTPVQHRQNHRHHG